MTDSGSDPGRRWLLLLAAAATAYLGLAVHAALVETPTVDEFAYVPAGTALWRLGRLDFFPTNPPLLKMLLAAPVALDRTVVLPELPENSFGWGPWLFGDGFMRANPDAFLSLVTRARLPIVVLGLLCGWMVFAWGRAVFGARAGACVATLFLFSPNVLAHFHLATIDAGSVTTILLTFFTVRWAYLRPSPLRLAVVGMAFGLAAAVKFIALLLLPAVGALAVVGRLGRTDGTARSLGRAALDLAIVGAVAILVVNASMGFDGTLAALGDYAFRSRFVTAVQEALPAALPVPLPRHYLVGFDYVKHISESGEFGGYLLGEWSRSGWWYYNLVALAVKTPLPTLALLLVAPLFWRGSGVSRRDAVFIAVPPLTLLFVFCTFNRANIGMRHVLAVMPFVFLAVGPVFMATGEPWRRRTSAALAGTALALAVVPVARVHPDYLTFFNAFAGGPAGGAEWLIDSNLDWGQDLYRVPEATRALAPDEPIYLLYFGHVDPKLYGIRYELLPRSPVRGVLAVSVNFLKDYPYATVTPDGDLVEVERGWASWLAGRTPVRDLGSILVFDAR